MEHVPCRLICFGSNDRIFGSPNWNLILYTEAVGSLEQRLLSLSRKALIKVCGSCIKGFFLLHTAFNVNLRFLSRRIAVAALLYQYLNPVHSRKSLWDSCLKIHSVFIHLNLYNGLHFIPKPTWYYCIRELGLALSQEWRNCVVNVNGSDE